MPEEHRSELRLAQQLHFSTASGGCQDSDILPKRNYTGGSGNLWFMVSLPLTPLCELVSNANITELPPQIRADRKIASSSGNTWVDDNDGIFLGSRR